MEPPLRPAAARMQDVAERAGVSAKTVSRVINQEPHVSARTREKVLEAIEHLDFRPDALAASMRRVGGTSKSIGVVLDSIANPFAAIVHGAIERVADAHHTMVFAASSEGSQVREHEIVRAFSERRIDGLILTAHGDDQGYLHLERMRGLPVVFADRLPRGIEADAVVTDNRTWAAAATSHLLDRGHRRIAFIGDDLGIDTARERLAGFRMAMASANLPVLDSDVRCGDATTEFARHAPHHLLDRPDPPTALVTGQNLLTIGAVGALHARNLQHEIALVGFDDVPLAELLRPAISVVAQDPARIGELAARKLFARIGGDTTDYEMVTLPGRLIARGSGEIPPAA